MSSPGPERSGSLTTRGALDVAVEVAVYSTGVRSSLPTLGDVLQLRLESLGFRPPARR